MILGLASMRPMRPVSPQPPGPPQLADRRLSWPARPQPELVPPSPSRWAGLRRAGAHETRILSWPSPLSQGDARRRAPWSGRRGCSRQAQDARAFAPVHTPAGRRVGPHQCFHPFPTVSGTMAPRKRSRQDSAASSSAPAAPTSRIDETHAAQLARHLAGLRKLRRFTDLKV